MKEVIRKAIKGYGKKARKLSMDSFIIKYCSHYPGFDMTAYSNEDLLEEAIKQIWKRGKHGQDFKASKWQNEFLSIANRAQTQAWAAARFQRQLARKSDKRAEQFKQEHWKQIARRDAAEKLSGTRLFDRRDSYEII